jgi:hypothetical protein
MSLIKYTKYTYNSTHIVVFTEGSETLMANASHSSFTSCFCINTNFTFRDKRTHSSAGSGMGGGGGNGNGNGNDPGAEVEGLIPA